MNDLVNPLPDSRSEKHPPIRILQFTDFHLLSYPGQTMMGLDTEETLRAVLAEALKSGPAPDLALLTGDLVQDAELYAYLRLQGCFGDLPFPVYGLPGNHDDPALMAGSLREGNVRFQPRIGLDRWQIICLDSTVPGRPHGRLADVQLEILAEALDQDPGRHALIALHHHPRPCASAWMDTMVLENADRFFEVLAGRKSVRAVVFGHVHQVMDIEFQGFRLLGAPSTCFQFKPAQATFSLDTLAPGWRELELYPDGRIETRVRRIAVTPAGLAVGSDGYPEQS